MAVGQVAFHKDKKVQSNHSMRSDSHHLTRSREVASTFLPHRFFSPSVALVHVEKRENAIVNRLNKTKVEREVNHEQERVDRLKQEAAIRRAAAAEQVRACLRLRDLTRYPIMS
jgi:hypothetical protein